MNAGALIPIGPSNADPRFVGDLGTALEERGFESLWVPDHVVHRGVYSSRYPYASDGRFPQGVHAGKLDPLSVLTYVAATSQTLRLGTGVCVLAQRNPVYVARQVADLDVLSGGRVEFGVGIGWAREEYEAVGVPFARRGARTTDYLRLIKNLWTEDIAEYHGPFADLPACRMDPKPVQKPHPPILIGGESLGALRRVAEVGDGWYSFDRRPDQLVSELDLLVSLLAEQGRTMSDIRITVCPPEDCLQPAVMDHYRRHGVHRVIARLPATDHDQLNRLLDRVEPVLRRIRYG